MKTLDGKTYPIRTLADIFNLPSVGHIERCLSDIHRAMIVSRQAADAMLETAKGLGLDVSLQDAIQYPEVTSWTDDDKDDVGATFTADGEAEPFLEIQAP